MDTQGAMRIVFYPAVIGWISLGYWITNLRLRIRKIERQANEA
jgi:heme exporter protein C